MKIQVGVKALIKRDDKYLFLRRHSNFKNGDQDWDIPGGRIEPNESLYAALEREINEETKLELIKLDRLLAAQDIFVQVKSLHVVRLTYIAEAKGDKVEVSEEHDTFKWMTLGQILMEQNIDSYLKEVLEEI